MGLHFNSNPNVIKILETKDKHKIDKLKKIKVYIR